MNGLSHIRKFLSNYFFILLSICVVAVFSLWETRKYFFYADDYALLYRIQHDQPYTWPYVFLVEFFTPLYKLFDMNHDAFFIFSLIMHILAAVVLYIFAKLLTKNSMLSLFTSLIFASAYIAIDQFSEVISSLMNLNSIFTLGTLMFYLLWVESKMARYYMLSVVMCGFNAALIPTRVWPLFLLVGVFDVIVTRGLDSWKRLVGTILRMVPFVFLAAVFIYTSSSVLDGTGQVAPARSILIKFIQLFRKEYFVEYFAILGRIFYWLPTSYSFVVGILVCVATIVTSFRAVASGTHKRLGYALLFSFFVIIFGYTGFFVYGPMFDTGGAICRYLTTSAIGFSLFVPIFVYLLTEKFKYRQRIVTIICLVVVLLGVWFSRTYENHIVKTYGDPSRAFFRQLSAIVPALHGKNIFYFDPANKQSIDYVFSQIVMSARMPKEVVLASYYRVPIDDVRVVIDDFPLLEKIMTDQAGNAQLHSFYISEHGLKDTTDVFTTIFVPHDAKKIFDTTFTYTEQGKNPIIDVVLDGLSSSVPYKVSLSLRIQPLGNTRRPVIISPIIEYLLAQKQSVNQASVSASPLLHDNDLDTSWIDSDDWYGGRPARIVFDMGKLQSINRIVVYADDRREPKTYTIEVSVNGKSWKPISFSQEKFSLNAKSVLIDTFDAVEAQFFRLTIHETQSVEIRENNLAPSLYEIRSVETAHAAIDILSADRYAANPFADATSQQDKDAAYEYVRQSGFVEFRIFTDNDENIAAVKAERLPLVMGSTFTDYTFIANPKGTQLKSLQVSVPFPAVLELARMQIISL